MVRVVNLPEVSVELDVEREGRRTTRTYGWHYLPKPWDQRSTEFAEFTGWTDLPDTTIHRIRRIRRIDRLPDTGWD
jgi:hypothetical protein